MVALISLPVSPPQTKEPSQFPPCATLDRIMREHNLSNAFVANLCFVAHLARQAEQADSRGITHPAQTGNPQQFLKAAIFLHERTLDMTHLSKFRNGHQLPWNRAKSILCYVFSQILGLEVEEQDLFPELQVVLQFGDLWSLHCSEDQLVG